MSFAWPWYVVLVLMAIPLAMLVWNWARRGREVVLPFDHGNQGGGNILGFCINLANCLAPILLAIALLIACGPLRLGEPKTKRSMTNIEFCVDISGSMTAKFGEGSRYDASMAAINDFLDFREGDAFGLTFFGNSVLHWVPLTTDISAFRCAPPFMRPESAPPWFGGTSIGKALMACRKILIEREEGDRMIVLVSDGFSSDLSGRGDEVAKKMNDDNIIVYAIHIAESEAPGEIVTITSKTGGEIFAPGDREGLAAVFRRIDEMAETRLEKTAAESLDNFFPYCLAGLSVVGLSVFSLFGVRYTPW